MREPTCLNWQGVCLLGNCHCPHARVSVCNLVKPFRLTGGKTSCTCNHPNRGRDRDFNVSPLKPINEQQLFYRFAKGTMRPLVQEKTKCRGGHTLYTMHNHRPYFDWKSRNMQDYILENYTLVYYPDNTGRGAWWVQGLNAIRTGDRCYA